MVQTKTFSIHKYEAKPKRNVKPKKRINKKKCETNQKKIKRARKKQTQTTIISYPQSGYYQLENPFEPKNYFFINYI